jgi:putative MATE family efflux protein
MFGAQNMTVGSPLKVMLLFTIPLLMGNVLQLFYNTFDSIFVGQYCGPNALAATGVSASIQMMFSVFFMTVGTGVSVVVSQYFGAKDKENLSKTAGSSILLSLIATVLAATLGYLLSEWVLKLINCPPEILQDATLYLKICCIGFVGMGFYNIFGGVLRGLGDSTFPLVVLIGTAVLDVLLDIWMIATPDKLHIGPIVGLDWGVAGAAWSTIIAQMLSSVALLWRLVRMKNVVTINRTTLKLDGAIVKQIIRIGLPSGLQMMIMSMSFTFVQSLINAVKIPFAGGFDGAIFVAVNTAIMKVDAFAMTPAQTFNGTAGTYTGQNIGAGKIDRVMKGFKILVMIAIAVALAVVVLILINGPGLIRLFINDPNPLRSEKITEVAISMMRIMVIGYVFMAVSNTIGGVMRGAGDTLAQLYIMIATNILIRIPLTVILINLSKTEQYPGGKPEMFFISMLIAFGLNLTVNCIYFATGRWKTKSVIRPSLNLNTDMDMNM